MTLPTPAEYVGTGNAEEAEYADLCFDVAYELLLPIIGAKPVDENALPNAKGISFNIWSMVQLEVTQALYKRKDESSGGGQYATYDGGPLPVVTNNDPLVTVYPIIRRYVKPF